MADGLYSNVSLMNICRDQGWQFITVFKDGNLPSVWSEVESLLPLSGGADSLQKQFCDSTHWITHHYRWIKDIEYQKHSISSILMAGRARWSIEDHFNTQKNRGGKPAPQV